MRDVFKYEMGCYVKDGLKLFWVLKGRFMNGSYKVCDSCLE